MASGRAQGEPDRVRSREVPLVQVRARAEDASMLLSMKSFVGAGPAAVALEVSPPPPGSTVVLGSLLRACHPVINRRWIAEIAVRAPIVRSRFPGRRSIALAEAPG